MKPTPVIKLIAWIYLLIGMENFFWTIFRFIYEGRHGHLTRTVLNGILALMFISLAVYLSRPRAALDEGRPETRFSPVPWAWLASLACAGIQYYRFAIWTHGNVNNIGISDALSHYFTIVHMYDTWFAMMTSLVLAQEYRRLSDTFKAGRRILHWEMTSGNFRFKGWLRKSLYLELNTEQLLVRTNLFSVRRVPLADIKEVRDVPMFLYPPWGIGIRFTDPKRKRERQVNFLSEDYAAWLAAFEQLKVPVNDESGVRGKKFFLYRWWRFYTVAKAAVRAFIFVTVAMTVLSSLLGPVLNKDYEQFENRLRPPAGNRFRAMNPLDTRYLRLKSLKVEEGKITLWTDLELTKYPRDTPAYFNHLFRDNKAVLYTNLDHTTVRFRAPGTRLKESPQMKNAGFLYAFPVQKKIDGTLVYRFVYLLNIKEGVPFLASIDAVFNPATDSIYWEDERYFRGENEFVITH